jgi:hypothetical protein
MKHNYRKMLTFAVAASTVDVTGWAHAATKYALDIDTEHKTIVQADPTPAIGTGETFKSAGVTAQDLYNSVYLAAAAPQDGTSVNVCSDSLLDKFTFSKQTAISLNIVTGADATTATPIPIYTVSASASTCSILFDHRYVFPPQVIASVSHNNISSVYAYKVTSTEKLSAYMKDALSLASQFVSVGGRPVVTLLTNVTSSSLAGDVRNEFNNAFSANNTLQNNLVDLQFESSPPTRIDTTYQIIARPLSFWSGKVRTDKPRVLGNMTVTIERDLSLIGLNRPGALPDYSTISETTKIGTVVEDASGKKQFVYDFLDFIANAPPSQAIDNLKSLSATATDEAVKKACSQLRVTLDKLGLNRLDATAFLWRVYTWSDHAQVHQSANAQGVCLESQAELKLIAGLDLMSWIRSPRAALRRHGVPTFFVPGLDR